MDGLSTEASADLKDLATATTMDESAQLDEVRMAMESIMHKGADPQYFGILKGMFTQPGNKHLTSALQRFMEKIKKQLGLKSMLTSCAGVIPILEDRNKEMTEEEAKNHKQHVAKALQCMAEEKQYKAHFQLFTAFSEKVLGSSKGLVMTMLDAFIFMLQAGQGQLMHTTSRGMLTR